MIKEKPEVANWTPGHAALYYLAFWPRVDAPPPSACQYRTWIV